jgi:hypothetical protein
MCKRVAATMIAINLGSLEMFLELVAIIPLTIRDFHAIMLRNNE